MRHGILLLLLLLVARSAVAQKPSSFDTRLATGTGPYPFYIALQGVHSQRIGELDQFADRLAGTYNGLRDHVRLNGIEGMLGVALNSTRPGSVHGLRIEISFQHLWRNFPLAADPSLKLRMQQDLLALRVGFRYNIFYPITLHFMAGPTMMQYVQVIQDNDPNTRNARAALPSGVKLLADPFSGIDLRARVVVFDPAGTSGGLSFFFEYQRMMCFTQVDLEALYTLAPGTGTTPVQGDFGRGAWSFGLIVPLALRWH